MASDSEILHTPKEIASAGAKHASNKHLFGKFGNKFKKPEYAVEKNITNDLLIEKEARKILRDPETQFVKTNNGRTLFFSESRNIFFPYNQRRLTSTSIYPPDPDKTFADFIAAEKARGNLDKDAVPQKGGYNKAFGKEERDRALERVEKQKEKQINLKEVYKKRSSRVRSNRKKNTDKAIPGASSEKPGIPKRKRVRKARADMKAKQDAATPAPSGKESKSVKRSRVKSNREAMGVTQTKNRTPGKSKSTTKGKSSKDTGPGME